jgi:Tol biopolymer transport system component
MAGLLCVAAMVAAGTAHAAFPGKNGKIVFQRSSGGDVDVFIMKSDGTRKRNLTPASIGSDASPAFSADGRKIVYLHNGLITIKRVDGKGRKKLNVRGRDPAFSPNGSHILFARERRGIFLMRVDGGGVRKLWSTHSHGGELVESPVFSSDGTKIAFSWYNPDTRDIVVADFAGGEVKNAVALLRNVDTFFTQPNFSPDGLRIVYTSYNPSSGDSWLSRIDLDGSNQQDLPPPTGAKPAFSPNGMKIVFTASGGSIGVIDADGGNQVSFGRGACPDWGPARSR